MTSWVYGVYVIQLRASYGPRDHPLLPALYVGSSHYTPAERFRQHRDGYNGPPLTAERAHMFGG